jgi:glycosyl transferase family 25
MDVVVISLRRAAERRASAQRQLESRGIPFEFFDAVEGSIDAPPDVGPVDESKYLLHTLRKPLPTELACYASHRRVWQLCAERNRPVVVLEDDFDLLENFSSALAATAELIEEFGFIRLESHARSKRKTDQRPQLVRRLREFELLFLTDVPLCMLAYALSPAAAGRLLRAATPITAPVDKFLQFVWEHETPIHALTPASVVASQLHASSTIGSRAKKTYDLRVRLRRAASKYVGEIRRRRFNRAYLGR